MSHQDTEAYDLQARLAECENAANVLTTQRDQLAQELGLAADGEAASTKIASNLHKEVAARAQQLESIRSKMAQQTEHVESLTKGLNEAHVAKDMALHHAAEVDAELQSLKRHAAQLSEQLASTMAGRAVGTLSGIDTVVAQERHARAATAAASEPPMQAASSEPSVTRRAMPRPWNHVNPVRMPVDAAGTQSTNLPPTAAAGAPAPQGQIMRPSLVATGRLEARKTEQEADEGEWLSNDQSLGDYIRSLDKASNARQDPVNLQQAHETDSAGGASSNGGEGTGRWRNTEAVFARWDGSDSDDVMGVPTSKQRNRGKAGNVAATIRPTNAWR